MGLICTIDLAFIFILLIFTLFTVVLRETFTLFYRDVERIDFTILTCPFREFKEVWLLVSIVTESHDSVFPDHCRL